jgi:hypothetical protein
MRVTKGNKKWWQQDKNKQRCSYSNQGPAGGGADHAQHIIYCLVEGSQFGANYHNKYILEIFILHGRLFWKYGWAFVWVLYKIHFSEGLFMYIQQDKNNFGLISRGVAIQTRALQGGGQIMPNTLFIGRLKVASLGLTIIKSIGNFHLTLKTASKIWMSLCMGSVQNSLQ